MAGIPTDAGTPCMSADMLARIGHGTGRPPVWRGERLERLRLVYEGPEKLQSIAHRFGISRGYIRQLGALHGWPPRHRQGGPVRWTGAELEQLAAAYAGSLKLAAVAADFKTCTSVIAKLARVHGWPRRGHRRTA